MIKPARALTVAVYDDVVAARDEHFHIPGVAVQVFANADDCVAECQREEFDVVFMDFALGSGHQDGQAAIVALRAAGYHGRIVAISSDPNANAQMIAAGANDSLAQKAHLRSYLVRLGETA